MSDLISRQDAVSEIDEWIQSATDNETDMAIKEFLSLLKERIDTLPSVVVIKNKAKEKAFREGYERGQAAAMRDASCRAYNEITKYLERQNVPRAKEKADYIYQIVKGFMADEVMGEKET